MLKFKLNLNKPSHTGFLKYYNDKYTCGDIILQTIKMKRYKENQKVLILV